GVGTPTGDGAAQPRARALPRTAPLLGAGFCLQKPPQESLAEGAEARGRGEPPGGSEEDPWRAAPGRGLAGWPSARHGLSDWRGTALRMLLVPGAQDSGGGEGRGATTA